MKFKPMRELSPKTPEEMETVVEKCLQSDPAKRYQSMGDLAKALEKAL